MKILDISMPLGPESITYPGDTPFIREIVMSLDSGEICTMSKIIMSSHSGTHLDAPAHFIPEGTTIDEIPLDFFYGPVRVIDLGCKEKIFAEDLNSYLVEGVTRIICKTGGWKLIKKGEFSPTHPVFSVEAADLLVEKNIRLVGFDFITVERGEDEKFPVHNELLSHNVVILEGLQLEKINSGDYLLAAFPLKIKGGDGSPCRAVLIDQS